MDRHDYYTFLRELEDIRSDDNDEVFSLLLEFNPDRRYSYLTPDECKILYGEFLTYLTEAEEFSTTSLQIYKEWMKACKYGHYIYIDQE